jgi:hypothetical protein
MGSIRSELRTRAKMDDVWSAVRDIGALHTRLVPGFVAATKLEPGARIVTFVNGLTLREPIIALDDESRRLVWTIEGWVARHYNASLQVLCVARGRHVRRLDRRFPAGRNLSLCLTGDESGNGRDAGRPGPACPLSASRCMMNERLPGDGGSP